MIKHLSEKIWSYPEDKEKKERKEERRKFVYSDRNFAKTCTRYCGMDESKVRLLSGMKTREQGLSRLDMHQTEIAAGKPKPVVPSLQPKPFVTQTQKSEEVKGLPDACIFVSSLSHTTTELALGNYFEFYGKVLKVNIRRDKPKPYGFVQFLVCFLRSCRILFIIQRKSLLQKLRHHQLKLQLLMV